MQRVYDIIHPTRRNLTAIRGYTRLGGLPDDPRTDPQDRSWFGPHDRLFTEEEGEELNFQPGPKQGSYAIPSFPSFIPLTYLPLTGTDHFFLVVFSTLQCGAGDGTAQATSTGQTSIRFGRRCRIGPVALRLSWYGTSGICQTYSPWPDSRDCSVASTIKCLEQVCVGVASPPDAPLRQTGRNASRREGEGEKTYTDSVDGLDNTIRYGVYARMRTFRAFCGWCDSRTLDGIPMVCRV